MVRQNGCIVINFHGDKTTKIILYWDVTEHNFQVQ